MGLSFSCPFSQYDDVENGFESIIVKSISLGEEEVKTPVRSVSFKRCDLDPRVLKSIGSEKMMVETSVSFKGNEFEETVLVKTRSPNREQNVAILPICPNRKEMNTTLDKLDSPMDKIQTLKVSDPNIPKHMAALKLQKVYKSFRTRRKLADCAVLVEQSWWKLLDFAELKRSSISFFEIEKHETAISRWSRARTRAAKVGKGLSKNNKAQKLALQHWLEAIDPRHRYGHNLHFYYVKWLHCQSKEPFFYWLDIGEGKEVNLVDKCHRPKLQQQCIKYLGPMERLAYEVVVEKGIFFYKQSREILDTTGESEDAKWIFVLSTSKVLYVGKKKKGTFQHSSFLAGGATTAAGRLVAENGILKAVWPHSGHYRPTEENFKDFVSFLQENNVDLSNVQMSPVDEDAISISKQRSNIQSNSSEEDLTKDLGGLKSEEKTDSMQEENAKALEAHKPRQFFSLGKKLSSIEIPKREIFFSTLENEEDQAARSGCKSNEVESAVDGYETAEEEINSEQEYMFPKKNLFDEESEVVEGGPISEESILKRINSHKGMKSFQLGKQLSCKWTTGAGPRIGCVRDYPWELQSFALEQVCLSPHNVCHSKLYLSPRRIGSGLSPKVGCGVTKAGIRNSCTLEPYRTQSSSILLTGIVNMF